MGVEEEAVQGSRSRSVQAIARYGMADTRQVDPDLMRPASADPHLQERKPGVTFPYPVLGESLATVLQARGHADAPHRVPRDFRLDGPVLLFNGSLHEGQIGLLDRPPGELFRQ